MKLNKKSQVFVYAIIIGFIAALSIYYFIKTINPPEDLAKTNLQYPGEIALDIIKSDYEAKKIPIEVSQIAKLSAYQSIYELANNGGFVEESGCGKYNNYNIWKQDCYPDYKNNFKILFNQNINIFLLNYKSKNIIPKKEITRKDPKSSLIFQKSLPKITYSLFFEDTNLYATTNELITIQINKHYIIERVLMRNTEYTDYLGYQTISPSFNIDMNYNIEEYNELIRNSQLLIESCQNQEAKESCINERLEIYNQNEDFTWTLTSIQGNLTAFNVETNKKIIATDQTTDFKPIIYKFALDLS